MLAIVVIAIAALLGSVVGAFFEAPLLALIWTVPLLALAEGAIMLAAPVARNQEALPAWLRKGLSDLADPMLALQATVACATGAAVAWLLLNYVRQSRSLRGAGSVSARLSSRLAAPPADGSPRPVLDRRIEGVIAPARPHRPASREPGAVFEVAPTPLTRFAPDPNPPPAPPPRRAGPELRRHPRRRAVMAGRLIFEDGRSAPCTIQDLSISGARVRLASPVEVPSTLWLLDVSNGLAHVADVAWRAEPRIGLRFRESFDLHTSQDPRLGDLRARWAALAPR